MQGITSLRAGDLRRLVSVQSRSTSLDAYGAQSLTWTELKKVYAAIDGLSGRELLAAEAVQSEVTHQITVRYDASLWASPITAAKYRIVYGARYFDIMGMINENERDSIVTLLAAEGLSRAEGA
jgi:SPP1 family predicted phage head-tail adaptor